MSFRLKIFLSLIFVSLTILGVNFRGLEKGLSKQMGDTVRSDLKLSSTVFKNSFQYKKDSLTKSLRLLVGDFAFKQAVHKNDEATLKSVLKNHLNRISGDVLIYFDMKGKMKGYSGKAKIISTLDKNYLKQVKKNGEIFFLNNFFDELYLVYLVPLKAPITMGYVALAEAIDQELLMELKSIHNLDSMIISPVGGKLKTVATTLLELKNKSFTYEDFEKVKKSGRLFLKGQSQTFIALSSKILQQDIGDFYFLSLKDIHQITKPFDNLKKIMFSLILVGVILSFVISFFFGNGLSSRIIKISNFVEKVGERKFEKKFKVGGNDEIEKLGAKVFKMAEDIENYIVEQEKSITIINDQKKKLAKANDILEEKALRDKVLVAIARKAAFSGDMRDFINYAISTLLNVFKFERAFIFSTVNHESFEVLSDYQYISANSEVKDTNSYGLYLSHKSILPAFKALQEKSPIVVNLNQHLEAFKDNEELKRLKDGTIVIFPLIASDKDLGVLGFVSKLDVEFWKSSSIINYVEAITSQIAMGMDNLLLYADSVTDKLTALYNRNFFEKKVSEEIKRVSRSDQPLSLVIIDIDYFKKFNDTYGHDVGDFVLVSLARELKRLVRDTDFPIRLGGEEFVILCPVTDLKGAQIMAEKLRESVAGKEFTNLSNQFRITFSAGVSQYDPEKDHDWEPMLKRADEALYRAKEKGRNRVEI